jgi:peroxiredoxin
MADRADVPGHARAFATLALAEYLAQRSAEAEAGGVAAWSKPENEYFEFLRTQIADEWMEYSKVDDPEPFRTESIQLFRRVLDKYADVPVTITAPGFRDLKTIGDKARKSLHALEHLYVGAPAPDFDVRDLDGNSLRLADYRGKVVLLSFWFTGCGPCVAMVPKEQELVEKFRDRPFALIGVCRDANVADSKKTASEHGMTWPSAHDGRPGKVTGDYNILAWPSFYLIDADGRIALKDGSWEDVERETEKLVERTSIRQSNR